jgi:hypothetical protein
MAEAQSETVPVIQLKPILDAQEKHGPIFRRELFDVAYAAYLSIDDKDPNEQEYMEASRQSRVLRTAITLPDIYGVGQKSLVLREGVVTERAKKPCVSKRVWIFNDLQGLGARYGEADYDRLIPFEFGTTNVTIEEEEGDSTSAEFLDKAARWRAEWEASDLHSRLTAFIEGHSLGEERVEQIICFGLGCPVSDSHSRSLRRSYVQHLAACTLRNAFATKQSGATPKVYAQDPFYKSTDTAYLADQFDISVIADPEGFRALNGSTFVMSISPNVPVRQIVLDMTNECNGPVGFLCDAIRTNGLEGDGIGREDAYGGPNRSYGTCNPSPGLWKYKQESRWMEHDDQTEMYCFGKVGVYLKK